MTHDEFGGDEDGISAARNAGKKKRKARHVQRQRGNVSGPADPHKTNWGRVEKFGIAPQKSRGGVRAGRRGGYGGRGGGERDRDGGDGGRGGGRGPDYEYDRFDEGEGADDCDWFDGHDWCDDRQGRADAFGHGFA